MHSLKGKKIMLTRSAEDCATWAAELTRQGAIPIVLPCIDCELLDTPKLRQELASAMADADWLVVTSRRGVEALAELAPTPLAATTRVAAVGEATAEAARATLGRADLIGSGGTAEALAAELGAGIDKSARVVLALAANAGSVLEDALGSAGARAVRFNVYRTLPAAATLPKLSLASFGADAVLLASPSAVEGFVNRVATDAPVDYFTIGPSTSRAAAARDLAVTGEAHTPSLQGLLEAMQCR